MKYRELKGYKYQLVDRVVVDTGLPVELYGSIHTEYIILRRTGRLFIKPGYCWDGASGPTIDTQNTFKASLVHDALYQLMRERLILQRHRKHVDELLRKMLIEAGMSKFRASIWYWAVRKFAKKSATDKQKPRGKIVEIKD